MRKVKVAVIVLAILITIAGVLYIVLRHFQTEKKQTTEETIEYYSTLQNASEDIMTADDYRDTKGDMLTDIKETAVKALAEKMLDEYNYTTMIVYDRINDTNVDGSENECITYVVKFDNDFWLLKYDGEKAYSLQDIVGVLTEEYE